MQKRPIIIFDPEKTLGHSISQALHSDLNFHVEGCSTTMAEATGMMETIKPQILIVNITCCNLEDVHGILFKNRTAAVIIISDCDAYALPSFEHFTIAYLLKPFSISSLQNALQKYLKMQFVFFLQSDSRPQIDYPRRILIEHGRHHKCISAKDITHLEAARDNTRIHTIDNNTYVTCQGIGVVEQRLDPSVFIRIHRSFIVNVTHITGGYKDITKFFISLPNYVDISIGRKYLPAIRKMMF